MEIRGVAEDCLRSKLFFPNTRGYIIAALNPAETVLANAFQVGSWLAQPSQSAISQNGKTLHVEPKVMEVLICLAAFPGETVSKEALIQKVWPDTFVTDDVLTRAISELRRVFEDDPKQSRVIQTIPKRGYRLVAPVVAVNGSEAESVAMPLSRESGATTLTKRKPKRWVRMAVVAAAAILLAILAAVNASWIRNLIGWRVAPPIRSLAVIPLQNLSNDPNQEYFSEGLTDALITDLARISALRVVSRTTAMQYKGTRQSLPEIARAMNVEGIVEGTVQRSGDRVRITAQLIYAPADRHIWANSFERDVKDVLVVQSTVAREIADQIQVKLTSGEQARLKSFRPVDPKALDAYVDARFHMDQSTKLQYYKGKSREWKEEYAKGAASLDRAIQEDPNYLPPYSAYFDGIVDSDVLPSLGYLPKAKAALTKALELDETDVAAHLALARLLMRYEYDWAGAEREYKRAIELQPNSGEAHGQYAEFLRNVGRESEGKQELEIAQALDPAHDYLADAGVFRKGKSLDEDRQILEEKAPNDPLSLAVLGKDYARAGRYEESVEMWERSLTLYGWSDFANVLKRADARGGPKFALEEWMRAGEEYSKTHDDWPVVPMAFTYTSLRNKDRALVWLDKAYEQRNWMIIYLKDDPVWDPLRSDPRFGELLRRVGLSE